jgi:hypothetical protein
MAISSLCRPCCIIRIVSLHPLEAAGQLLRALFLDREGHISAEPHCVPHAEALIRPQRDPARAPGRHADALSSPAPAAPTSLGWPEGACRIGIETTSTNEPGHGCPDGLATASLVFDWHGQDGAGHLRISSGVVSKPSWLVEIALPLIPMMQFLHQKPNGQRCTRLGRVHTMAHVKW